jgi:hypothetical protein
MSSEKLGSAKELLKGNLGGSWDILEGSEGNYTDLGIARRFGGAAAAYSLRDIGAMNGRVVKARRSEDDLEEDFSANQVQDGTLEKWVNGELESALPADVDTAAAAYSLRKVKASYGIPNTVVNGTENFPATVPSSGSPADIGNGFTAHKFSDGVADSESVTVSGGTITVTAIASGTGSFSAGCRLKGLADGKQYTVSGEFRVTSQGADGGGVALVDISDDTAGTDEDSITTSSTTFTPFFIDAGYNGGSNDNFVDLQANSSGSNSGTLTAEFRNVQIIENNNSAVRIRRSSDDEEVVVGFDADNKVSASSPVTATPSGSTTATSVAEFLSEERTTFITNPVMSTVSGDVTVLSNDTSSTEFTFTFSGSTGDGFVRHNGKPNNLGADIGDTVSFDITASGLSQQCGVRARKTGANNDAISPGINNIDNGTQTITFTVTTNGPVGYFCFVNLGSASTGTIRVHNLKVVGKSATVHTWYDQAGSNNAVQETASNQPKIAENGALIADENGFPEIQFTPDASNGKFLSFTTINFSDTMGIFFKSIFRNSGGSSRTLSKDGSFTHIVQFLNAATVQINTTTDATFIVPNFTTSSKLHTILTASDSANYFGNAASADSPQSVDMNSDFQLNTIGASANSSGGARADFDTSELIFYTSDQSDNRFKIESNINNYYSLYNDANEFSGNPTAEVTPSAITLTNVSKTGFTAEISSTSGTKQINFPLLNSLVSGDDYFVSFDYTSTSTSTVGVKPRTAALGSASNDVISATNSRFYGGTGDAGHNGFDINNTATVLSFQTTAQSFTFTVSNLKVSRIARNGFVETWYDQSGNFRPLIQSNASEQPSIVENGGFLGGVKADVATSNDTMQNLQVSTDGTTANFGTDDWANGGTKLGLIYVGKVLNGTTATNPAPFWGAGRGVSQFQTGAVSFQIIKGGNDSWRLVNERQDLSPSSMTTLLTLNSDDDVIVAGTADNRDFTITVNASSNSETESADLDVRETTPISLFGAYDKNNGRYYQRSSAGVCKECYLFSGDNITEVDTISTEINKHYNIY